MILIKISKNDAVWMREHGYADCVKKSYSNNPHYYLVEEADTYGWNPKTRKKYVKKQGALSVYYDYRASLVK